MPTLPRDVFDSYRETLYKVREHSSRQVRDAIDMLEWGDPAQIKRSKKQLARVIQFVVGRNAEAYVEAMLRFGNLYSTAAAWSELENAVLAAMETPATVSADVIESTIDYNAKKLEIGDFAGFRDAIADHTGMYTKRVAYETLGKGFALSSGLSTKQARALVGDRGVEIAWIPSGDTCAFCIALASRGWQPARYERFGDYAEHVHAHCDCELVFRANSSLDVDGYDVDELRAIYYDRDILPDEYKNLPDDEIPWQVRINAIRRAQYAQPEIGDRIREQHSEQYAATHPHDEEGI